MTTHNIRTVNVRQYRYSPHLSPEIQIHIADLISNGIVEEYDLPYNFPLWIVPKKSDTQGNEKWPLVIGFCALYLLHVIIY